MTNTMKLNENIHRYKISIIVNPLRQYTIHIQSLEAAKLIKDRKKYNIIFKHKTKPIDFLQVLNIISYLKFYLAFKGLKPLLFTNIILSTKQAQNFCPPATFEYTSSSYNDGITRFTFKKPPLPDNQRDAVDFFPELFST